MAKTNAQMVRESMARRREKARAAGLCYTCCRRKPDPGFVVCVPCNSAALERQKRRRRTDREALRLQHAVAIQERAGDMASTYHLYTEATQYYQEALGVPGLELAGRERIVEKIGNAFFLSGDLKTAHVWFERLLRMYRSNPQEAEKSVETLYQIHRQLIADCEGEAVLTTMMRAVRIAELSGDSRLTTLTQLRRVEALQVLGRFSEAVEVLRNIGPLRQQNDALLRGYYFVAHAMAAGIAGDLERAYENFDAAVEQAKQELDPYRTAIIWLRYGVTAQELGDSLRAKACFEQALFVVQQYGITWMIALLRLYYAKLLARMGQSSTAYPYLLEVLSSSALVPFLDAFRAYVGIPLALQFHDRAALAQCAQLKTLEFAFQSKTPAFMGGVAHAFAQLYVSQGRLRAARALLHRALGTISDAYQNLDVLITIAQHGAPADIPRARALIEARTALPHPELFRAGLAIFDAFAQRRRGALVRARTHVRDAIARFDALQWHEYAELARSIAPGTDGAAVRKSVKHTPFSHLQPALTAREREVAALVLRGYTNRKIADELNIAPHTVEKHMNSIMNRLGVRSRYQVADLLGSGGGAQGSTYRNP